MYICIILFSSLAMENRDELIQQVTTVFFISHEIYGSF